jgi:hypothetical protein
MTAFFVKKFKDTHRCNACKADKLSGYSLCPTHLERAKQRWRGWSVERRAVGKCCYCDRKSFRGWLRCRHHTKLNRAKIRQWMIEHPTYGRDQWLKRLTLRAHGVCACRDRGQLRPGQRRCDTCIARRPQYEVRPRAQAVSQ